MSLQLWWKSINQLKMLNQVNPVLLLSSSSPSVSGVTLFLNLLACLAYFTTDSNHGVDFGLSILWLILFTPCSFLCWYRPIYRAFKWVPALSASPTYNSIQSRTKCKYCREWVYVRLPCSILLPPVPHWCLHEIICVLWLFDSTVPSEY